METLLARLPAEALSISLMQTGAFDIAVTRSTHNKVAPCTIIAQAYEGRYGIRCGARAGVTEPEGLFLATAGDLLTIDHLGDSRTGRMQARWLHVNYRIWGTIDLTALLSLPLIITPEVGRHCGTMLATLCANEARNSLFTLAQRQALAWALLTEIARVSPLRPDAEQQLCMLTRFHPIVHYIQQHLAEPITIEHLAAIAHLSPSRLYAIFQRWFHASPQEYIKRQRMHAAAHLLLSTEESIAEIAVRSGFANPFHFSREFKRLMGVPPSAYRRWDVCDGNEAVLGGRAGAGLSTTRMNGEWTTGIENEDRRQ